ncbi:MAG: cupin domain-containing protein [Candidatus Limnocylindria bacterium]
MRERVRVREREPEPRDAAGYWVCQEHTAGLIARGMERKIVVRGEGDREWELGPMGRMYRYFHEGLHDDTALSNWWVFKQDIRVHSGAHRHQGGLIIYVIEGSGYTIIDGVKEEWEAGDLLLLPLKPGGVEHQHFNAKPGGSCKWIAFIWLPWWDQLLSEIVLTQDNPDWKAAGKPSAVGLDTPSPAVP